MATTRSHNVKKAIEGIGRKLNRQMVGSLAACVHCGICTNSCHYVLANRPQLRGRLDRPDSSL